MSVIIRPQGLRYVLILAILSGCSQAPAQSQNNPYQARAIQLVTEYNTQHGTHVPVPSVRVGRLPNLDEGHAYCNSNRVCTLVISAGWGDSRHGEDYAMSNTLPHELAHHTCLYLRLCPPGDYHGPVWQKIALEYGLDPRDGFITDNN